MASTPTSAPAHPPQHSASPSPTAPATPPPLSTPPTAPAVATSCPAEAAAGVSTQPGAAQAAAPTTPPIAEAARAANCASPPPSTTPATPPTASAAATSCPARATCLSTQAGAGAGQAAAAASTLPPPHPPSPQHQAASARISAQQLSDDELTHLVVAYLHGQMSSIGSEALSSGFARIGAVTAEQLTTESYRHFEMFAFVALGFVQALHEHGRDDERTLQFMDCIIDNMERRGQVQQVFLRWSLPRAAAVWGVADPRTRSQMQVAAQLLWDRADPRNLRELTAILLDLGQQLPDAQWDGLAVTPVPDEDAYYRHCVMHDKAVNITMKDGASKAELKLAQDMLTRCVAYHDGLGPHWLGTPRKLYALLRLAYVAHCLGDAAADTAFTTVKLTAKRQLGKAHTLTFSCASMHGIMLIASGRKEQALSVFEKLVREQEKELPAGHHALIANQIHVVMALKALGKREEAKGMIKSVFDIAVRAQGPTGQFVRQCVTLYWELLDATNDKRGAAAFKRQAAKIGCDVSRCTKSR